MTGRLGPVGVAWSAKCQALHVSWTATAPAPVPVPAPALASWTPDVDG